MTMSKGTKKKWFFSNWKLDRKQVDNIFNFTALSLAALSIYIISKGQTNPIGTTTEMMRKGDTQALIYFMLFLIVFRKPLRLNNPSVATIAKVSLMIISSYFSYKFLLEFEVPPFISMVGGLATVLAIQQTTSFTTQLIYTKKITVSSNKFMMYGVVIFASIFALFLDMGATVFNLVHGEGIAITRQENFETAMDMKLKKEVGRSQAIADSLKFVAINKLIDRGQYGNMRVVAQADTGTQKVNTEVKKLEKKRGNLEKGFARIVGEKKAPKVTFLFILSFAISLTFSIIVMEVKEEMGEAPAKVKVTPSRKKKGSDKKEPKEINVEVIEKKGDNVLMTQLESAIVEEYFKTDQGRGDQTKVANKLDVSRSMVNKTLKKFDVIK